MTVYFIQAGDGGPVKIGYTGGDISHRLREIQNCNATECSVLRVVGGGKATEREIQKFFSPLNIRGEWFKFSIEMLRFGVDDVLAATPSTSMTLKKWLSENKQTQAGFAESLGWSQGYVSKIVKAGTNVLSVAVAIEKATNGDVTTHDLLPQETAA